MDDFTVLGIGRTLIELSLQKEQLLQQVKQLQEQAKTKAPVVVAGD